MAGAAEVAEVIIFVKVPCLPTVLIALDFMILISSTPDLPVFEESDKYVAAATCVAEDVPAIFLVIFPGPTACILPKAKKSRRDESLLL